MKKKDYQKPTMRVFELNKRVNILTTSSHEKTGNVSATMEEEFIEEDI